jgi:hypothetical protein
MKMKKFGFLCLIFAALVSCASQKYYITVRSTASVVFSTGNVIILPVDGTTKANDETFARVSFALKEVLSEKGYHIVSELNDADIIANVAFGIAEDSTPHAVLDADNPYQENQGTGIDPRTRNLQTVASVYASINDDYPGEYTRYLTISAYRKSTEMMVGNPPEIWTTTMTSKGFGRDLNTVIPRMIEASANYIGTDRRGIVMVGRLD